MRPISSMLVAPVAAIALSGCGLNSVPIDEEAAKAKWADVQAAYQRRASLIPNLEATVKGAAASEKSILIGVTEARSKASSVQLSADELGDPAKVQRFAEAQGRLSAALVPFRQLQEQYPDLKSQANFTTFMSQLEGTENRINIAIGAKIFHGAKPMTPFQATTPGADTAPTVTFDTKG